MWISIEVGVFSIQKTKSNILAWEIAKRLRTYLMKRIPSSLFPLYGIAETRECISTALLRLTILFLSSRLDHIIRLHISLIYFPFRWCNLFVGVFWCYYCNMLSCYIVEFYTVFVKRCSNSIVVALPISHASSLSSIPTWVFAFLVYLIL